MLATKKRKLSSGSASVAKSSSSKILKSKSKSVESATKKRKSTKEVSSGSDLESGSEEEEDDNGAELESGSDDDEGLDPMEVMRRHFESQFAPLEVDKSKSKKRKQEEEATTGKSKTTQRAGITETYNDVSDEEYNEDDDADSDSEGSPTWDSDDEEEGEQAPKPVVVDFTNTRIASPPRLTVKARKALSTSGTAPAKPPPPPSKSKPADDDPLDALNLQNDLSLQRLLKESHLLDASLELTGKNRHKATAMRIAELATTHGVKTDKTEKMPMNMRKGMIKAQESREEKRRREAKEAGIILEKARKKDTGKEERRDRGLNLNGMGKFRNGALVISKKEVDTISASVSKSSGGRGGKKGGRGGRGGKRK
ncbi:hypothetical protein BJ508DRAFT_415451 [Ascobolus immersus RN42]|uniref:Uncharacterized protein n=1 Tax=Ascobolus immersus RN42 TaxID=1160509 RepID=A0A3N4I8F9_ASCIM|nr:hypothetical protein BJ508DRAFT_415451 [Ascobolus immersus RN42]